MGMRTFTFAGTSSSTYNLFITEAAPYNAPSRSVEMIAIPGRNGAYALDKGNFENIEVTYHVCVYDEDQDDFAGEISDVRNWLCSKVGYQRLTDDYNANEYRMAIYKSGLETDEAFLNGAEFDITFECKPQRWLTSGETKTTLTSGNAITNPTLFDARPQLQVYGYGDINIGSQDTITVENVTIGNVQLAGAMPSTKTTATQTLDVSMLNTGDDIAIPNVEYTIAYTVSKAGDAYFISGNSSQISTQTNCSATMTTTGSRSKSATINVLTNDTAFTKGTSGSFTPTVGYRIVYSANGSSTTYNVTATCTIAYDGNYTLTYSCSVSTSISALTISRKVQSNAIYGISSKSALGSPTYIDLDIGEAYFISGGSAVSVNNSVSIPAELPTLPSGATTITFDNTFTKVDIIPRWWKV